MSRIVDFFDGTGKNQIGQTFEDIMAMSNEELESGHHQIQWCFPLKEPSQAVPGSPIATDEDFEHIRSDEVRVERFVEICWRWMQFYGIGVWQKEGSFTYGAGIGFHERSKVWLKLYNHNYKRLTRIITSMHLMGSGFEKMAKGLQSFLLKLADDPRYSGVIGPETKLYWIDATKER